VSRIELDALDRGSVERARQTLADSQAVDFGHATDTELLSLIGSLQAQVGILLRVIDGGEQS
jgi:hypothetical protein